MDAAESRRPPRTAGSASSRLLVALGTALPVLTVFFWLTLVYGWEAWGNLAPWLNSDEFERAQLSRAIAETGHAARRTVPAEFDSLYVYLIAPAWWIHDTSRAYGVAKAIGVVTMTSVIFPTYLLARMLVSRRWALFAAAGAAMIPALAYSEMLLVEPLAYPWAALCFYLLARALVTPTIGWIAAAAGACLLSPLVRPQFVVTIAGAAMAVFLFWFTGEHGRRFHRSWTRWDYVGFVVLLIVVASVADVIEAHRSGAWQLATQDSTRTLRDGLWAAGGLTIGLGVLPTIAGLTALFGRQGEGQFREQRAFVSLAVPMIVLFGFYSALKAAYIATLGVTEFVERNLIYVAPLLFVGTAIVFERRRPRVEAVIAASAFALLLVTTTPYHMDIPAFFDAPGLAILPGLSRAFGLTPGGAKLLLISLVVLSAVLLLATRRAQGTAASIVFAAAAAFVLAWNVYGEISFARSSHKYVRSIVGNVPRPLNWIDRAVPDGTDVYYLGQSIDDPNDLLQLEFWNRSLKHVWSTDGTAPGPAPTVTPAVTPEGRLEPNKGVEYMVADYGVLPVGRVIARKIHLGGRGARPWTLMRIAPPLRLRQTVEGIYPDGWGRPETALNQFSTTNNTPSVVKVSVKRTGAARLYPATVRVRLGTLGVSGGRAAMAAVLLTRRLHVRNHLNHVFTLRAPPAPFRVETSITPFPHDRNPAIGDPRDLGGTVSYSVTPV